jgi:serine-type D-Ala-D-Ala carboxypeptidase (penicillin-binding protein 5/6)
LKKRRLLALTLAFILSTYTLAFGIGEEETGPYTPTVNMSTKVDTNLNANSLETTAESAVIMEYNTGRVIYSKNQDKQLPPASVTKVMTMLLAVEAVESGKVKLDDKVVTSENAWKLGGSQIYLEPGEEMTYRDMLQAVAVGSANDASVAMAEHIGGSVEEFVNMMNEKAKSLGLKHTHFVNPYGLPAEGHYTSAYDMAVISREALKYPLLREMVSQKELSLRGGEFRSYNTNKLLWWYKGADGIKTGWTNEAKYCLASTVERDGLRLITVVLATPEVRSHFRESMKLYNWAFARYKAVKIKDKNAYMGRVKVNKGVEASVDAITLGPLAPVVLKGEAKKLREEVRLDQQIVAPIQKGQKLGEVVVYNGSEVIGKVNIVASHSVAKGSILRQFFRIFSEVFSVNE